MSCPEDNDAKRLTRFYLYRRIKNLWSTGGTPNGLAMVLAGDEASEIGCLRNYLGLDATKVHFVDIDKSGLEVVKQNWRKAKIFQGKIEDAIRFTEGDFALINFDFCGYMNMDVEDSVAAAKGRINQRGVIAYTFVRDRESANTPNWKKVQEAANSAMRRDPRYRGLEKDSPEWLDAVRFVGYSTLLKDMLGRGFETIFMMRYAYQNRRNMGVIALQYIPPSLRTPKWRKEFDKYSSYEERIGYVRDVVLRDRLRDVAMSLTDTIPSREVADILHLPPTTMAAWQAHKTRGTYRSED